MYSRSYYPDDGAMRIPDNYDGTALLEKEDAQSIDNSKAALPKVPEGGRMDVKMSPHDPPDEDLEAFKDRGHQEKAKSPLSLLSGIKLDLGFFEGFGIEELLIIGLALFLLFSRSGDKECALMLLVLILI